MISTLGAGRVPTDLEKFRAPRTRGFSRLGRRAWLHGVLAPIAPLVGSILGLFFAWVTRAPNARSSVGIPSRSLLVVILFSLLVFAPVCSYFLAFAPDWSYAYLVDSEHLPSTVDLGLVLLNVTAVPAGFLIG